MKKLLALLLVLVVCVGSLASCAVVDFVTGIINPGPAVSIDDAADYLYNMYKDDEGKATRNDYDLVGKVTIDGVSFEVTWVSNNDKVVIKESSKANFWTVDVPDVNAEEFEYTLTATIKAEDDSTVTKTFTRKVPVVDNSGIATQPEAEVAYKLFFYQGNKQKTYYALNTIVSSKYIDTTEDPTKASDYYAEADGEGYKFYTTIDGAKKYVEAYLFADGETAEGTTKWSKRIRFSDEGTTWTYKADCNAWFTTIQDGPYVLGTYSTFTTFSISDGGFMSPESTGVSQFPAQLILSTVAEANGGVVGPVEHTCADANGDYKCDTENCDVVLAPAANSTLTLEQATALGKALLGEYTTDKYFITGTITEVYNTTYGNMYITDGVTESFCIYGTYDATGANRYDAMANAPVAGDEITVWGVIGSYNGNAQMKNGWIGAEAPEQGGAGDTPVVPTTKPAPEAGLYNATIMYTGTTLKYLNGENYNNKEYWWAFDDNAAAALFEIVEVDGGYNIKMTVNATGVTKYLNIVINGTHINVLASDTAEGVWKWDSTNGCFYVTITGTENDKDGDYTIKQQGTFSNVAAYKISDAGNMVNFVAATAHTHDYTISATCTSGTACVCGATTGNPVPHTYADDTCKAIGTCTVCGAENPDGVLQEHNYVDGACSVCQQPENATSQTATVTVSVIANTGVLNGDTISWTSGDISVIDQKGGSNSDIRTSDSDHFRVYAYNDFTVSTSNGKLTEVVINCTSSTYAEKCLSSMTAKGYTATQNEKVITITLDGTLDSITCNAVAQFRIDSVKVTYTYMG